MLTIYRRHTKACPHHSRNYRRCQCPIWVQGTLGEERVRKGLDLTSWDAAEDLILEWKKAGRVGAEGRKRKTVKEAVELFLKDAEARYLREGTLILYRQNLLKTLVPWAEAEGVSEIRRMDVEKVRRFRESWTCAEVTAARRVGELRAFFTFCVDSGWMEKNPAKALRLATIHTKPKMPFTDDELARIFSACDELVTRGTYGKENRARVKAFIYILRYTGLRISDATRLDEARVRDGRVFLRTEKRGTLVWVPIPQFVVDTLAEVPRVGPYYFQTGHAKPKTVRGGWDRTIRTVLKLAGVEHGSAHVFRTTLAVDLLAKGVPVETVAAILGNSPAIVLKHYAPWVKARQDALESAVRSIWDEEEKPKLRVIQGGA
jgi:integrase/recombinase XerD